MALRVHMVRRWAAGELAAVAIGADDSQRALIPSDAEDLGRLLWSGFGFHGVDGFASADAARGEAHATLSGKWGPVLWEASMVAICDGTPVAASVVLRDDAHDRQPLLGFLVTDRAHQRRGIGAGILAQTLHRMDAVGLTECHLAVVADNPARTLYRRAGFVEEPRTTEAPAAGR